MRHHWSHSLTCRWNPASLCGSVFLHSELSQITGYSPRSSNKAKRASLLNCIHIASSNQTVSRLIAEGWQGEVSLTVDLGMLALIEHSPLQLLFKWKSSLYSLMSWQRLLNSQKSTCRHNLNIVVIKPFSTWTIGPEAWGRAAFKNHERYERFF